MEVGRLEKGRVEMMLKERGAKDEKKTKEEEDAPQEKIQKKKKLEIKARARELERLKRRSIEVEKIIKDCNEKKQKEK